MQIVTLFVLFAYIIQIVRHDNIFRPHYIFSVIMLSALLITGLRISRLQSSYDVLFYITIYLSVLIVNVTHYITKKYSNLEARERTLRNVGTIAYDRKIVNALAKVLWILITVSVVITIIILGAPPAISMTDQRDEYFVSGWGTIYSLNTVLFALLIYDRFQKRYISNMCFYVFGGMVIIYVVLMANKFQIFTLLIVLFTEMAILKKGQALQSLFILAVIVVLVFLVMYVLIYSQMYNFTADDTIYWYKLNLPARLGFLAQPYLYVANNFENLFNYMKTPHHYMFGYNILYNATRNSSLCNLVFGESISKYASEFRNSLQMGAMNTGSCLLYPYRDFGVPGIIAYSCFCGFVFGQAEKRLVTKKDFASVFIYAYAVLSACFSFFSENLFSKPLIINLLSAMIISPLIHKKIRIVIGKRSGS